jgi:hypothetical protein
MEGSDIVWYSCDECGWHSEETCGTGCEWVKGGDGGCVPLSILNVDITCEKLSKPLCDRYHEDDPLMDVISGVTVTDMPCFFNGRSDSVDMLCASVDSIGGGDSCAVIETNDVVTSGGKERYCDNAPSIFGFPFDCVWKNDYYGEWGLCGNIYYLTNNGMIFFFSSSLLLFYIIYEVVFQKKIAVPLKLDVLLVQ